MLRNFIDSKKWLVTANIVLVLVIFILIFLSPNNGTNAQSIDSGGFASVEKEVYVSVIVLPNLSLSIDNGLPIYTTNWPFGATLRKDIISENEIYWTATADY
ncbi:MAG: hypothetical protein ACNFW9_04800 [Candidatus Kerfeldbacteria bacterium]